MKKIATKLNSFMFHNYWLVFRFGILVALVGYSLVLLGIAGLYKVTTNVALVALIIEILGYGIIWLSFPCKNDCIEKTLRIDRTYRFSLKVVGFVLVFGSGFAAKMYEVFLSRYNGSSVGDCVFASTIVACVYGMVFLIFSFLTMQEDEKSVDADRECEPE